MKKSTRRICYIVLALLAIMTFTGCPSCGGKVLSDKLIKHLNEKYDKEFEITKLVKEFDGDHGWHYRAVFHEKDSQENSVLYCYKDDLNEGTIIRINGIKHAVVDDYADIVLQEQYAALIQEELGEDVLVKCQFLSLNYMISDEVFAAGLEACLNEEDKNQSACVFVFADMNKVNSGLRERTEYIMDKYEANHQYLYFSYHESFDKKEWETIYEREYDSFDFYLVDESNAKRVETSYFSRNYGNKECRVVKE